VVADIAAAVVADQEATVSAEPEIPMEDQEATLAAELEEGGSEIPMEEVQSGISPTKQQSRISPRISPTKQHASLFGNVGATVKCVYVANQYYAKFGS